jgi:hypothetical protein
MGCWREGCLLVRLLACLAAVHVQVQGGAGPGPRQVRAGCRQDRQPRPDVTKPRRHVRRITPFRLSQHLAAAASIPKSLAASIMVSWKLSSLLLPLCALSTFAAIEVRSQT